MVASAEHAVEGRRVVLPDGVRAACVRVRGEKIVAVGAPGSAPGGVPVRDVGDRAVLPGLFDPHVHINEPGRTEWEGFETATRAAAAGGITALFDMPLNSSPVTTTVAALEAKARAAAGKCTVDHGFWGGVVPGNAGDLEPLARAGLRGFKCFLVPSGIDEFPNATEATLREAMPILARLGRPLLVHAELPGPIERASPPPRPWRRYADYLASRPRAAENEAIALVLRLVRETGCRAHIVHLVSSDALPMLRAARAEGLPVTVETCPHYLTFAAEDIPLGATQYKCAPPIRERANREALWAALAAGDIDFVATDHSPCPPELKRLPERGGDGDFGGAWGGVSSLELLLPAVWTEAAARGHGLERLAQWLSLAPARLAGLEGRKGAIAPGHDADLVVFDPDASFTVDPARLRHRHKVTPYAGLSLRGVVETTYLRGRPVYDRGAFPAGATGVRLDPPEARAPHPEARSPA